MTSYPVVATLILIIVAVFGAVAIGAILGAFSHDVSGQITVDDIQAQFIPPLTIGGSTDLMPVSELLAAVFQKAHPGIRINVLGGGSDAGVSAAELGSIDIGSSSSDVDVASEHKTLQKFLVGGTAVAVIINPGTANLKSISKQALLAIYNNCTASSTGKVRINTADENITVADIADPGGTEFTVYKNQGNGAQIIISKFMGYSSSSYDPLNSCFAIEAQGNQGMVDAINANENSLGFCTFGFAGELGSPAKTLNITDESDSTVFWQPTEENIKASLNGDYNKYPCEKSQPGSPSEYGLARPLYYVTRSSPTVLQQQFIDYARSSDAAQYFHMAGVFHVTDLYST